MRDRRILRAALVITLVQQLIIVILAVSGFRPSRATFLVIEAVILTVSVVAASRYLGPRPK